jgi:hypothetical protein
MDQPHDPYQPEAAAARERSIGTLLRELSRELATLLRQETELARAEIRQKAGQFRRGAGELGAGALAAFAGFLILLHAGVYALGPLVGSLAWAALLVGGAALAVGVLLLLRGRRRLTAEGLVPARTIDSLRQDAELASSAIEVRAARYARTIERRV